MMWNTFYVVFGSLFAASIVAYILLALQHRRALQPLIDQAKEKQSD